MRAIALLAVLGALLVVSVPVASAAKVICLSEEYSCNDPPHAPNCMPTGRCELGIIIPDTRYTTAPGEA